MTTVRGTIAATATATILTALGALAATQQTSALADGSAAGNGVLSGNVVQVPLVPGGGGTAGGCGVLPYC